MMQKEMAFALFFLVVASIIFGAPSSSALQPCNASQDCPTLSYCSYDDQTQSRQCFQAITCDNQSCPAEFYCDFDFELDIERCWAAKNLTQSCETDAQCYVSSNKTSCQASSTSDHSSCECVFGYKDFGDGVCEFDNVNYCQFDGDCESFHFCDHDIYNGTR